MDELPVITGSGPHSERVPVRLGDHTVYVEVDRLPGGATWSPTRSARSDLPLGTDGLPAVDIDQGWLREQYLRRR
jgi:hypothetical protein